jgi:voltage-gated potassium channel Kch
MKPLIIVCGLGDTGYAIFSLLQQQGARVIGLSDRPISAPHHHIIIGDFRADSTLIAAGIHTAKTLVLAGKDEALNLAILTQARILNPQIRVINRLFNKSLGNLLDQTLPDHVTMSVAALSSPVFAFAAQGNQAIGHLKLFNKIWSIHAEYITENHPWNGKNLTELWDDRSRMLIYYLPVKGKIDLVSAVIKSEKLQVGDRLIIGTQPHKRNNHKSRLQKLLKIFNNLPQFPQHLQPLFVSTFSLFLIVLIATVTYTCGQNNINILDAVYFSVGIITGTGGDETLINTSSDSLKVFTILIMLFGAAIVGLCYALLNEFILGTRLKQFWDVARVPHKNHYIICGLGGVGMEIVNQLHHHGDEIVVIERDNNNRFLNTVRNLAIPVIQEDASLTNTLKSANIQTCSGLLAVTSNDLVNLEIALTAKSIVPKLPVIVRNKDAKFAHDIQQVFQFEAVLSPTELAAPSFVAAALGGRILGNGITGNILWVALGTMITPHHIFCGKKVKDAAIDADFVPLYVETKGLTIHGWDLLETCLSSGDVLYLTMPANKLEQLWKFTPINQLVGA